MLFHLAGMLILIEIWGIKKNGHKILVGAIGIVCPVVITMYTFSMMNFAIGAGYFFIALSVLIFTRARKGLLYLAIIPGILGIAMYQAFLPTLLAAYLSYILLMGMKAEIGLFRRLVQILIICAGSILGYWGVQQLFQLSNSTYLSAYITNQLSLPGSWSEVLSYGKSMLIQMFRLFSGHESIYVEKLYALGIMLFLAGMAYLVDMVQKDSKVWSKLWSLLLLTGLLVSPFVGGFFMQGNYAVRFLLAYPLVIAAVVMLGLSSSYRFLRIIIGFLAIITLFRFAITDNRLFAANHLVLQADRLVASNLTIRIADAKEKAESLEEIKYLEFAGYLDYPETKLIPEIDTFGGSFFFWDGGSNSRIIYFLRTLGIMDYEVLPGAQRLEAVPLMQTMPVWPVPDSVKVVGDVVLIKFGDYSSTQMNDICSGSYEGLALVYQNCLAKFNN
ncbi:MAG: glucosyltransferase domain-containing protein [Anaerolineaceae bacterium]|nr:glucosyltransferase domain-containing protein [Anaerolineaceae bacterium]